jgi:hypothetical protein
MITCPSREHLERFLDEQLLAVERDRLAAHVGTCPCCQEALEQMTEAPGLLLREWRRSAGVRTAGEAEHALGGPGCRI